MLRSAFTLFIKFLCLLIKNKNKNCVRLKIFSDKKSFMSKQKYQILLDPNEAIEL
jgi:hypothetical protein